jgi:hypothetical protein
MKQAFWFVSVCENDERFRHPLGESVKKQFRSRGMPHVNRTWLLDRDLFVSAIGLKKQVLFHR